ncbi:hypothetical protein B0T21DRAFT_383514 [Apiosordaria backusii]|uniref:PHD-type domain-containing protein n=1 Tax=Apiosordaria backusii TaxID=314023 RepID=A0AA40EF45_9PEZI|nr:hypothetical protein B0T21DRAFT_383514 [Apiosordaria backusii]
MAFSTSFFTLDPGVATDNSNHPSPSDEKSTTKMERSNSPQTVREEEQPAADLPNLSAQAHFSSSEEAQTMHPPPSSDYGFDQESVTGDSTKPTTTKSSVSRKKKGTATVIKPPKRSRPGGNTSMGGSRKTKAGKTTKNIGSGAPSLDGGDIGSDPAGGGSESDSGPYCLCRGPDNHRFMIACDRCEDWFHGDCIGMDKWTGENLVQKYICPNCSDPDRGYVTRYKKMCSYSSCKNAARIDDPARPSIFCSDDHCQMWWNDLICTIPKAPKTKSNKPTGFLDNLTREDFISLLDSPVVASYYQQAQQNASSSLSIIPGQPPLSLPPDFWTNPPPNLLTSEQENFLSTSASERKQLGEEMLLCKKMLELIELAIERRDGAISSPSTPYNKDLCGYDVRLDHIGASYQFSLFLQTDSAAKIFKSGKMEDMDDSEQANWLKGDEVASGNYKGGMCTRKKCPAHRQWRDILTKMVKHDVRELTRGAKQRLDGEQRVRDAAAGRWFRKGMFDGDRVEVIGQMDGVVEEDVKMEE